MASSPRGRRPVPGHGAGVDQVVEGVGAALLASVDQAHEQITDLCTVQGAIEQSVLTMQNRSLEGSFDHIIIKRSPTLAEE